MPLIEQAVKLMQWSFSAGLALLVTWWSDCLWTLHVLADQLDF
jgi:hypothetical protein